jgi:type I restriction-modification system DNA methylase subunit
MKYYNCEICGTKVDNQKTHHKSHLSTGKHGDKVKIFELELEKLTKEERRGLYKTSKIVKIISKMSTNIENIEEEVKDVENIENIEEDDRVLITNREALKNKIHEIHNYLRNNGAGYGMNALKVFNIIYGLKKIEENGLFEKVNLSKECRFSYLLEIANKKTISDDMLRNLIINDVLNSIHKSKLKKFMFYEIPKGIKCEVFSHLIKKIQEISTIEKDSGEQLSGKIYEYFIGRDQTAISELGAYFTNRHIVNFIYENELKPIVEEDGTIENMIDMFGGSGGFTTGYIMYLLNQNKNINWETEINKIFHFDMNEDVIKSAGLEFFCLTGQIPNMNNNLKYKNSFKTSYDNKKFKYIITNPPYGGDKNRKSQDYLTRDKIEKHIKKLLKTEKDETKILNMNKQLSKIKKLNIKEKIKQDKNKVKVDNSSSRIQKFAKTHNLTGNDKESVSLILMMDLLEENGTAIGVLKEGVFFNSKYKKIRECLIKNFNVRKVISVPQDSFENTSTKTSIVIFDNTKIKTSKIQFYDLKVDIYEDDVIELVEDDFKLLENKGDIKPNGVYSVSTSVATFDNLENNGKWSLNSKEYNIEEIKVNDKYELVKLGDVCDFLPKSKKNNYDTFKLVKIRDIENNIIANFDKIKNKNVKTSNICEYNDILISNVRPKSKKSIILTKSICKNIDEYCFTLPCIRVNEKLVDPFFVYSILYKNIDTFEEKLCTGSTYPTFKITQLANFQIPIPKDNEYLQEWVNKISKPYNEKNEKLKRVLQLEEEIKNKISHIIENEECENIKLKNLCKINDKKYEKYETSFGQKNGKHSFHTGSSNAYLYCDNPNILIYSIILNKTNGSGKCNIVIDNSFSCAKQTHILQCTDQEKNIIYVYYYFLDKLNILEHGYQGACHKNLDLKYLKNIKIPIPKNRELINVLDITFKEIISLKEDIKNCENNFKIFIQELSDDTK